jgi:hypothetical protein
VQFLARPGASRFLLVLLGQVVSCGFDHTYALKVLLIVLRALLDWVGDDALGLGVVAVGAITLTLLSRWTLLHLIVSLREKVGTRARNLFYAGWLNFLGFNFNTCIASVVFATALYMLLKIAFRFPEILHVWATVIILTLLGFSIVGWFVSGRVKPMGFIKHFYIPALAGVAFFLFNVVLDFAINVTGALVTFLVSQT